MKKILTLKNVIVWAATLIVLIAFFLSFGAKLHLEESGMQVSYNNIIWGCNSGTTGSMTVTFDSLSGLAVSIIGLFLMLLAAIGSVVVPFVLKDEKKAKMVTLCCGGAVVVGGILMFFTYLSFAGVLAKENGASLSDMLDALKNAHATSAMPVVEGILAIVAGGAIVASEFVPNKQLLK